MSECAAMRILPARLAPDVSSAPSACNTLPVKDSTSILPPELETIESAPWSTSPCANSEMLPATVVTLCVNVRSPSKASRRMNPALPTPTSAATFSAPLLRNNSEPSVPTWARSTSKSPWLSILMTERLKVSVCACKRWACTFNAVTRLPRLLMLLLPAVPPAVKLTKAPTIFGTGPPALKILPSGVVSVTLPNVEAT